MGSAYLERTAETALARKIMPDDRALRLTKRVGGLTSNSAVRGAGKVGLCRLGHHPP